MPKNSFLIEDILENKPKSINTDEYKGTKKRIINNLNSKPSPSLSPGSMSSSTSSSDDNNNFDLDYIKQQYIKQAFPTLILNQYLNLNPLLNDQMIHSQPPNDYNILMASLLNGYSNHHNDESLNNFLSTYYTKVLSNTNNLNELDLVHKSKRIKLDLQSTNENKIYNLKRDDNSQLNLTNSISPKSVESNENVSPLDALLQLANNINKNGLINQASNQNCNHLNESTKYFKNDNLVVNELDKKQKNLNLSSNSSFDSLNETSSIKLAILPKTNQTIPVNTNSLKRKRKNRTAFTANQIFELEKRFSTQRYLSPHDRDRIAYELQLTTAQVITWFQNRRAKQKRDLEELKNDVNAAKTLKVIDPDLDVDKIICSNVGSECLVNGLNGKKKFNDLNSHSSSINDDRKMNEFEDESVNDDNSNEEDDQDNDDDNDDEDEEINIDNDSLIESSDNNDLINNSADNGSI